jgi:lipid-binding SYLF domain-containing protein
MFMMRRIGTWCRGGHLVATFVGAIVALSSWLSSPAAAGSAREIDTSVDEALVRFEKEVKDGKIFLESSKGVLVFPSVFKGGLVIGTEEGEGALRIGGKTVDYYGTTAASIGLQAGGQVKTVFVVFLEEGALKRFRESEGWKAGVDGSIALVTLGAGRAIDTETLKDPIVGFVFDQKGLMSNLTFEVTRFMKLDKR